MVISSSSRRFARLSVPEFWCTCTTMAKPSSAVRTAITAVAVMRIVRRRRAGSCWVAGASSGTEDPAADRRDIAEDADAEHDDHRCRELAADPQLVAEIDDQRR